jgi:hypothetical protein
MTNKYNSKARLRNKIPEAHENIFTDFEGMEELVPFIVRYTLGTGTNVTNGIEGEECYFAEIVFKSPMGHEFMETILLPNTMSIDAVKKFFQPLTELLNEHKQQIH